MPPLQPPKTVLKLVGAELTFEQLRLGSRLGAQASCSRIVARVERVVVKLLPGPGQPAWAGPQATWGSRLVEAGGSGQQAFRGRLLALRLLEAGCFGGAPG